VFQSRIDTPGRPCQTSTPRFEEALDLGAAAADVCATRGRAGRELAAL
jgi:hypothetical protein